MKSSIIALLILIFVHTNTFPQKPHQPSVGEIELALKKLNILCNVLYVAAHPDDENTRLITYMANERLYNTSYLSLTRGDGGQNLIGKETSEQLGVIRTQELLQARKIDGGDQFFSRANDFGFSKHPDETFKIWDENKVLSDVVWVIRKFKPDVIITRFSLEAGRTHGHHTASAILAERAFKLAADSSAFPEQLKYVQQWQAKRIVWNSSHWFYANKEDLLNKNPITIDVGGYQPAVGKSYGEIAAQSRSMHRSQGFGSSGTRGSSPEYFEHIAGPKAEKDIFEGVQCDWSKVDGGVGIKKIIDNVIKSFDPTKPYEIVPQLIQALAAVDKLEKSYWKEKKAQEIKGLIKACMGLYMENLADQESVTSGEKIKVSFEVINRSPINATLKRISSDQLKDTMMTFDLKENLPFNYSTLVTIPDQSYSEPYWLRLPWSNGMYQVNDQNFIGLKENQPLFSVNYILNVNGTDINFSFPITYKQIDPVEGEIYQPLRILPPVMVNLAERIYLFSDNNFKTIEINLIAGRSEIAGKLYPELPQGWRIEPSFIDFKLDQKGGIKKYFFKLFPTASPSEGEMKFKAKVGEKVYDEGYVSINYPHIPTQVLLPPAVAKVAKLDIKRKGKNVGYIMGAGDNVPAALTQIGYKVEIIEPIDFNLTNFKKFDAIVLGIRSYNTVDALKFANPALMSYVKEGGNLIVQYNTLGGFTADNRVNLDSIGPYPFKIANERITDETATAKILNPTHPIFNIPNKITSSDFEGWVQERGLYFPKEWGKEYTSLVAFSDPGEQPKEGALLIASYGKGNYIYTGLSFFRQLPAGVPGAYKLFSNIVSLGRK